MLLVVRLHSKSNGHAKKKHDARFYIVRVMILHMTMTLLPEQRKIQVTDSCPCFPFQRR